MSTIHAQTLIDRTLSRTGPPIVAGCVVFVRTDDLVLASLILVAMVSTDRMLRDRRYPVHLVPLARYMLAVVVPAGGVALAYLLSQLSASSIDANTAVAALITSTAISLATLFLGDRFAVDRPIRTLVIGDGDFARMLREELQENRIRSYQLLGYIDGTGSPAKDGAPEALPHLGDLSNVRAAVQRYGIDLLVVSPELPRLGVFEETVRAWLDLRVRLIEATALYETVLGHVPIGAINSAWFQYIMHPLFSPSSPLSKRLLDIVLASVLLLITAPIIALAALAVKLEDRGPVFYRQRRVGEEGREFDMIKFRTLRPDADRLLAEGHSEEEVSTRTGQLLRKVHLNELPQIWQVIRGEMSLVGPRPEPPTLVQALSWRVPYYDRRALVKPGLTGWAQVRCGYAGSQIGTAWKTCHDLYYIKHRSVGFDLLILLQTFHALVESDEGEQVPAPDFILGDATELMAR